jgi:hypothetical protein
MSTNALNRVTIRMAGNELQSIVPASMSSPLQLRPNDPRKVDDGPARQAIRQG